MASEINNRVCPCCGEPIVPYQEVCLNCNVYMWEVAEDGNEAAD